MDDQLRSDVDFRHQSGGYGASGDAPSLPVATLQKAFLALALLLSFVLLPGGVFMSDTHGRWYEAMQTLKNGSVPNFWAPGFTMLMLGALAWGIPAVTLQIAQLAVLWAGFAAYIRQGGGWILLGLMLVPVHIAYASFVVPDVWVLSFLFVLAAWFASPPAAAIHVFGTFAVCLLLFAFRLNAFALVPVLVGLMLFVPVSRVRKSLLVLAIVAAIPVSVFGPRFAGFTGRSNGALGLVWENVSVLKVAQEHGLDLTAQYNMDYLGDTRDAVRQRRWDMGDNLFWPSSVLPAPYANGWVVAQQQDRIFHDWLRMVRERKGLYLRAKARMIACQVGLCGPQSQIAITENPHPMDPSLPKGETNSVGRFFLKLNGWLTGLTWWLYAPALWMTVAAATLVWWRKPTRSEIGLGILGITYMSTHFVAPQAITYRYMFPTVFICAFLAIRWGSAAWREHAASALSSSNVDQELLAA